MKMIQILPVVGESGGLPFALVGLDDEGRVWYGTFEYGGKKTTTPARRRHSPRRGSEVPGARDEEWCDDHVAIRTPSMIAPLLALLRGRSPQLTRHGWRRRAGEPLAAALGRGAPQGPRREGGEEARVCWPGRSRGRAAHDGDGMYERRDPVVAPRAYVNGGTWATGKGLSRTDWPGEHQVGKSTRRCSPG